MGSLDWNLEENILSLLVGVSGEKSETLYQNYSPWLRETRSELEAVNK